MDLRRFLCDVAAGRQWRDMAGDEVAACVPVDDILHALRQHRLVGRLSRRLTAAAPNPEVAGLVAAVNEIQAGIEQRGTQCLAEIVRVQEHLAARGHRSILLKGPSVHLINGRATPLRPFGDIDLLVPGTSRGDTTVIDIPLRELGYQHIPSWPCGVHEAGHLVRGDDAGNFVLGGGGLKEDSFALDIHHSFPIWGYPDIPPIDPARPGRIEIDPLGAGSPIDRALIGYELLAPETRPVETPLGTVVALTREAAALLSCAHLLKDDIKPHWLSPFTLRLGELAEVLDLVRSPQFDADRFRRLAQAWSALDAVSFVAGACRHCFGYAPAALARIATGNEPHHTTIWSRDHHPVVLSTTQPLSDFGDKVIQRSTMRDYVSKLGEVTVAAEDRLSSSPRLVIGGEDSRSFAHRRRGSLLEIAVSVSWRSAALVLRLAIANGHGGKECVLLNFGDPALELYGPAAEVPWRVRNRAHSGPALAEQVTAIWGPDGSGQLTLDVEIPWTALPGGQPARDDVSFIAGLQALAPDDPGRNATVFAPLKAIRTR